jgi:hypothetical protein
MIDNLPATPTATTTRTAVPRTLPKPFHAADSG